MLEYFEQFLILHIEQMELLRNIARVELFLASPETHRREFLRDHAIPPLEIAWALERDRRAKQLHLEHLVARFQANQTKLHSLLGDLREHEEALRHL